ncbi:MAG: hypothetical protein ACYC36_06055 [Bellilinea sp.]
MVEHSSAKNAKRAARCRVCGKHFRYRGDEVQYLCVSHRSQKKLRGGKYKIITFVEGLRDEQEDFLAAMIDIEIKKIHLVDLAQGCGMDGAVVQHIASGAFYKIERGEFIEMQKPAG